MKGRKIKDIFCIPHNDQQPGLQRVGATSLPVWGADKILDSKKRLGGCPYVFKRRAHESHRSIHQVRQTPKPDPEPEPEPEPEPAQGTGFMNEWEAELLDLVNGERTSRGLRPLESDE